MPMSSIRTYLPSFDPKSASATPLVPRSEAFARVRPTTKRCAEFARQEGWRLALMP